MSGMMTFRVINKNARQLRNELTLWAITGNKIKFEASSIEDTSPQPTPEAFVVTTIEKVDYHKPWTFDVRDELSRWIRITIIPGEAVEFDVQTP